MNLFWLKMKYRWERLWMCKHERAWADCLIYGSSRYRMNEFFGTGLVELIEEELKIAKRNNKWKS